MLFSNTFAVNSPCSQPPCLTLPQSSMPLTLLYHYFHVYELLPFALVPKLINVKN